ncbi:hypothetical protein P7C73_g1407, partial [Tremellales sp. Uapishka_1]
MTEADPAQLFVALGQRLAIDFGHLQATDLHFEFRAHGRGLFSRDSRYNYFNHPVKYQICAAKPSRWTERELQQFVHAVLAVKDESEPRERKVPSPNAFSNYDLKPLHYWQVYDLNIEERRASEFFKMLDKVLFQTIGVQSGRP